MPPSEIQSHCRQNPNNKCITIPEISCHYPDKVTGYNPFVVAKWEFMEPKFRRETTPETPPICKLPPVFNILSALSLLSMFCLCQTSKCTPACAMSTLKSTPKFLHSPLPQCPIFNKLINFWLREGSKSFSVKWPSQVSSRQICDVKLWDSSP